MTSTIALWENPISKTETLLSDLPHSRGKRVKCLNGCGTDVSGNILMCRKCKRKGKIIALRNTKRTLRKMIVKE